MDGQDQPPRQPSAAAEERETAKRGRRWGRLLALLGGLVLICVLELALWIAGYGGQTALFVTVPDGDGTRSYVTNVDALRATFISNPVIRAKQMLPSPGFQRFPVRKPADTCRIFVVGGSAARGFPYNINAAFPAFLQTMLNDALGEGRVEVINAAVTAVNSYTIRERAPELPGYGADLLVVYSGHNEFYGAYGVASAIPLSSRRWLTLAQMWLRRRRLTMVMGDLVAALCPEPPPEETEKRLAEIMPRRTDIRYGTPTYGRVRENYRANLRDVVRSARRGGLPVVLCTLGANLRDFPPLGSLLPPGMSEEAKDEWRSHRQNARRLAREGDPQAAAEQMRRAVELAPGHADTHFQLAQVLDRLGRDEEAAEQYRAARDRDVVRWRTGTDFNRAVREVAREAADPRVVLCDVETALADRSEGPVPGAEQFLEHVHFTLEGAHAAAAILAESLRDSPVGRALGEWNSGPLSGLQRCLRKNQVDTVDRLMALNSVVGLYRQVLSKDGRIEERAERLRSEMDSLVESLEPAHHAARTRAEQVVEADELGALDQLLWFLSEEFRRRGQTDKALAALRKIKRFGYWQLHNEQYSWVLSAEAMIRFRKGEARPARRLAQRALRLNSRNEIARAVLAALPTAGSDGGRRWPGQTQP